MAPSIYITAFHFSKQLLLLHYFTLLFIIALHDGRELVAYVHFVIEDIKDERCMWLVCGHKANICVVFLLMNQYIFKILGTESWGSTWSTS